MNDRDNTEFTVPDGVLSVGSAFCASINEKSTVTRVTLPKGITELERYAFYYCRELKNVTLPESITAIGNSAFNSCLSLESIEIPSGVSEIALYTFSDCNSLASIKIPTSVTSIEQGAFQNCRSLKDIYYEGTKKDWKKINIEERYNEKLCGKSEKAKIHYKCK
jgi:hypothetical protein